MSQDKESFHIQLTVFLWKIMIMISAVMVTMILPKFDAIMARYHLPFYLTIGVLAGYALRVTDEEKKEYDRSNPPKTPHLYRP